MVSMNFARLERKAGRLMLLGLVALALGFCGMLVGTLYSRYYDYTATQAQYKVYIEVDPSQLYTSDVQRVEIVKEDIVNEINHMAWVNYSVEPETAWDLGGPTRPKAYDKAVKVASGIIRDVSEMKSDINALIGNDRVDFSDGNRLMTVNRTSIEHAKRFYAAMRNESIPTRFVSGHIFANGEYMFHIWNELWIEDKGWITIDVTNQTFGSDNRYIRLFAGNNCDDLVLKTQSLVFGVERTNW